MFDGILLCLPSRVLYGARGSTLERSASGLEAQWCREGNAKFHGCNSAANLATRVHSISLCGPDARELQAHEGYFSGSSGNGVGKWIVGALLAAPFSGSEAWLGRASPAPTRIMIPCTRFDMTRHASSNADVSGVERTTPGYPLKTRKSYFS